MLFTRNEFIYSEWWVNCRHYKFSRMLVGSFCIGRLQSIVVSVGHHLWEIEHQGTIYSARDLERHDVLAFLSFFGAFFLFFFGAFFFPFFLSVRYWQGFSFLFLFYVVLAGCSFLPFMTASVVYISLGSAIYKV